MRSLIIAFVVVGLVFVGIMILRPGGGPSREDNNEAAAEMEAKGPPSWLEGLGSLTAAFAPKVTVEAVPGRCAAGELFASAGDGYRVARAHLTAGEGAAVVFSSLDPRRAGEDRPVVLCLKADGAAVAMRGDCGNDRPSASGTLAVGPSGGCIAILPIGLAAAPKVSFD
jgi:hypothetical protein